MFHSVPSYAYICTQLLEYSHLLPKNRMEIDRCQTVQNLSRIDRMNIIELKENTVCVYCGRFSRWHSSMWTLTLILQNINLTLT